MFEDFTVPFAETITNLSPYAILAPPTKRCQCIAGRLAVRLDASVITDATNIGVVEGLISTTRLMYGGAAECTEKAKGLVLILIEPGPSEPSEPDSNGLSGSDGAVEKVDATLPQSNIKVLDIQEKIEEKVDLGAAKLVFCVGRGIVSENNVTTVQEIASRINAEVACTRPIAEGEGWLASSRYLGVSGAFIKPDMYIGLGVSGQVQHTVGMKDSKLVVAVNKDKNAPIMKQCDIGLVANIENVLPALQSL